MSSLCSSLGCLSFLSFNLSSRLKSGRSDKFFLFYSFWLRKLRNGWRSSGLIIFFLRVWSDGYMRRCALLHHHVHRLDWKEVSSVMSSCFNRSLGGQCNGRYGKVRLSQKFKWKSKFGSTNLVKWHDDRIVFCFWIRTLSQHKHILSHCSRKQVLLVDTYY